MGALGTHSGTQKECTAQLTREDRSSAPPLQSPTSGPGSDGRWLLWQVWEHIPAPIDGFRSGGLSATECASLGPVHLSESQRSGHPLRPHRPVQMGDCTCEGSTTPGPHRWIPITRPLGGQQSVGPVPFRCRHPGPLEILERPLTLLFVAVCLVERPWSDAIEAIMAAAAPRTPVPRGAMATDPRAQALAEARPRLLR